MKTQALLIADDPAYLAWLQKAVPDTGFSLLPPSNPAELLQRLQVAGRPDVVIFQFTASHAAAAAQSVERIVERLPELPVIGLGEDASPALMLAAMRAGARDFFVLQRDEADVAALLDKLLARSALVQNLRKQGRLFAVWSADAHESIAFLGQHLALACVEKAFAGERTILLDVALPAGAAALFLNINQSYGLLDAVRDVNRCDQTLVDTAFGKHTSGLYVLSLPEELRGSPQLDVAEFVQLLQVLRSLFANVVVALDGHFPMEGLCSVITQADRALLLTNQSILKSRHCKHLLRQLRADGCSLDRAGLVVDHYRAKLGLEPEHLAELLELPLIATLSSAGVSRLMAMNSGESLFSLAPKDPYAVDVRRMASALLSGDISKPVVASQGRLGRLFS